MGVVTAVPISEYEIMSVDITKIGDTKKGPKRGPKPTTTEKALGKYNDICLSSFPLNFYLFHCKDKACFIFLLYCNLFSNEVIFCYVNSVPEILLYTTKIPLLQISQYI